MDKVVRMTVHGVSIKANISKYKSEGVYAPGYCSITLLFTVYLYVVLEFRGQRAACRRNPSW